MDWLCIRLPCDQTLSRTSQRRDRRKLHGPAEDEQVRGHEAPPFRPSGRDHPERRDPEQAQEGHRPRPLRAPRRQGQQEQAAAARLIDGAASTKGGAHEALRSLLAPPGAAPRTNSTFKRWVRLQTLIQLFYKRLTGRFFVSPDTLLITRYVIVFFDVWCHRGCGPDSLSILNRWTRK